MEYKSKKRIVQLLQMAEDYIEGEFSGIPLCCIREFVENGRMYYNFKKSLPEASQVNLNKFNYVPCDTCLQKCQPVTLRRGFSEHSETLNDLMNKIYYSGETKPPKRGPYANHRKKVRRIT
jgi:hypothetical protein